VDASSPKNLSDKYNRLLSCQSKKKGKSELGARAMSNDGKKEKLAGNANQGNEPYVSTCSVDTKGSIRTDTRPKNWKISRPWRTRDCVSEKCIMKIQWSCKSGPAKKRRKTWKLLSHAKTNRKFMGSCAKGKKNRSTWLCLARLAVTDPYLRGDSVVDKHVRSKECAPENAGRGNH